MSWGRGIYWYIDIKPTTAKPIGTSSGTMVVEKVLIGEEEKKEQEKEFELAQFACLMGYVPSSKKFAYHS